MIYSSLHLYIHTDRTSYGSGYGNITPILFGESNTSTIKQPNITAIDYSRSHSSSLLSSPNNKLNNNNNIHM